MIDNKIYDKGYNALKETVEKWQGQVKIGYVPLFAMNILLEELDKQGLKLAFKEKEDQSNLA